MKSLFKGNWLEIREKNGYEYVHDIKSDSKGVAVLLYRTSNPLKYARANYNKNIMCSYEILPYISNTKHQLVALTGMVENGKIIKTAIKEVYEEAGYKIKKEDLVFLGKFYTSKASDYKYYLFCCEIKDSKKRFKRIGDGSNGEKKNYCKWTSLYDINNSKDPILITLWTKTINHIWKQENNA